jgi:hypothetical protein
VGVGAGSVADELCEGEGKWASRELVAGGNLEGGALGTYKCKDKCKRRRGCRGGCKGEGKVWCGSRSGSECKSACKSEGKCGGRRGWEDGEDRSGSRPMLLLAQPSEWDEPSRDPYVPEPCESG